MKWIDVGEKQPKDWGAIIIRRRSSTIPLNIEHYTHTRHGLKNIETGNTIFYTELEWLDETEEGQEALWKEVFETIDINLYMAVENAYLPAKTENYLMENYIISRK